MTQDTNTASGAADLLDLIEAYAEARHRQGHSSYNAQTAAALQAVKDALAAGQATAAQAGVQDDLITLRKPATSAEMLWLLKLAHLVISDVDKTLEETFAPAQQAAQQGAAYAALPTSNYAGRVYEEGFLIGTCPLYTADQLHTFADATHTLRASHGLAPADLSPTAGMNIPQRILHVGGRNNDAGYVEFGSIQAVEALVRQVLRDLQAPAPADSVQEDAALWRWLAEYLVGTRTDLDDEIVACETVNDLRKLVKAAIKQGATQ